MRFIRTYFQALFFLMSIDVFAQLNSIAEVKNESINEIQLKPLKPSKDEKRTQFLSSNNYVGYEYLWPNLKKGWKNNGPWISLNAQASFVRAGIGFGNAYNIKNEESVQRYGNFKYIGLFYNHPIHIIKNFIAIEPEIGLDFISGQFRDDREKDPNSFGFGITPGIGVKVGPLKVVGKYTTSFAYSIGDKTNAWSGGMNYPSLGLFFETGWGMLSPKRIASKGIITTSSETRDLIGVYLDNYTIDNYDYVAVYRVVTTYYDHQVKSVIHDVRPFWFIAPKVNSSLMVNQENGNTLQYGAELGFRASVFGGEVFYNTGTSGFLSPVGKQELINQYGFAPDLTGTMQTNSYGAKAGLELVGMLTKIFVHSHENTKIYNATRFTRLLLSYGVGQTQFVSKPVFTQEFGEQQLSQYYQLRPDLKPADAAIPGQAKSANFTTLNVRFEMGMIALGYEKHTYKSSPFANNQMLTLSYLVPPGRIVRKIRTIMLSKKIVREKKKRALKN